MGQWVDVRERRLRRGGCLPLDAVRQQVDVRDFEIVWLQTGDGLKATRSRLTDRTYGSKGNYD